MIHYETEKKEERLWLREKDFSPRFELKTESVFSQVMDIWEYVRHILFL